MGEGRPKDARAGNAPTLLELLAGRPETTVLICARFGVREKRPAHGVEADAVQDEDPVDALRWSIQLTGEEV